MHPSTASNIPTSSDTATPTPANTPTQPAPNPPDLTVSSIKENAELVGGDGGDVKEVPTVSGLAIRDALAAMMQEGLSGFAWKSLGYNKNMPVEIKLKVEALKGVQTESNEVMQRYRLECFELKRKYHDLQKPFYERRKAIVAGTAQPTPSEIEAGEKQSLKDDKDYVPLPKDTLPLPSSASTGITGFWLTALRNHITLTEFITVRDEEALKSLTDITLEYFHAPISAGSLNRNAVKPGFKLLFYFAPNDYFENDVLEKSYIYQEEIGNCGNFMYDKAVGSKIRWKEDKNLTMEFEITEPKIKNTDRTRSVRQTRHADTFFNFFTPPIQPIDSDVANLVTPDGGFEEIEEKLEIDYQLGENFKEEIIPHAIDYFTGKALEAEFFEDEGTEDGDDRDGDDGDDGDESDDEFDDVNWDESESETSGSESSGNEASESDENAESDGDLVGTKRKREVIEEDG